jgi:hypothetical protein
MTGELVAGLDAGGTGLAGVEVADGLDRLGVRAGRQDEVERDRDPGILECHSCSLSSAGPGD